MREAKTAGDRLDTFIEAGGDLATVGQQMVRRPGSETTSTPQAAQFPGAQAKDGPARFRAAGHPIGIRDDRFFGVVGSGNSISLATGPALWVRLMPPHDTGKRWTIYDLKKVLEADLALQPFLWGLGYGGFYKLRAEDGIGSCALLSRGARNPFGGVRVPD